MGFGWMFLGYLFFLRSHFVVFGVSLDITPDVIGFLLMAKGVSTAAEYCACFRLTKVLSKLGVPLSLLDFLYHLVTSGEWISAPAWLTSCVNVVYTCFLLFFTLSLLYSLYLISIETDCAKTKKKAARSMVCTVIFFSLEQTGAELLSAFGLSLTENQGAAFEVLCGVIYILLNAATIFSCYMWICLEGDEDMPDNRKHAYKTPFDYFDAAKERDAAHHSSGKKKHKK